MTTGAPVEVRNLSRRFGEHVVIDGLDLHIEPGEFVALLGASGCGKSTLLRILADLDRDITGDVSVARGRAVGFQAPRLMPWKRVWRNVVLGLPGRPDRERAEAALAEVGLSHRVDVWPKVLSGGEAQRVALARSLVREPDLLLLDEPFSALDALTRLTARGLVDELWQRHRCAVLLVTHDVEEALVLADRVLVMDRGRIAHDARVEIDRPRDLADPALVAMRTDLLARLGVDVKEHA
ncbi:ABC transporter ATP-binding protein [Actinomycetospora termitidis]|uniref:ABC transporter ATP-binding protein n=1 Tax=Actinomycetospora termitidis TaxID=3053470 RepID=A0ABT7MI44_9PSEU|nr:ABC transporter ATP-binding protein [Actinomycetospora sp. Odt1-22]MDL5160121.1 ABC transporter ATP-binding protein [Actinomycetospora sp. Odt1-22]